MVGACATQPERDDRAPGPAGVQKKEPNWNRAGTRYPKFKRRSSRNTGRPRLNINGAINVETLRAEVRFDDTIEAASTNALFQQIEQADPDAPRIILNCDNDRYDRSKAVAAFLPTSRIQLEPLPPYCPNLNLIERFWTFFKRQVRYTHDYETFEQFRTTCRAFFRGRDAFAPQLRTLLTENFQIIGKEKPKTCIA